MTRESCRSRRCDSHCTRRSVCLGSAAARATTACRRWCGGGRREALCGICVSYKSPRPHPHNRKRHTIRRGTRIQIPPPDGNRIPPSNSLMNRRVRSVLQPVAEVVVVRLGRHVGHHLRAVLGAEHVDGRAAGKHARQAVRHALGVPVLRTEPGEWTVEHALRVWRG